MDNEITGTCGNAMPDEIHRQWEAAHRLSLAPTPTLTVIGAAAGELAELRAKLKTAEAQLAAAREREAGMLAWQALVTEAIGDAFEIAEDLNASVEFEGKAHTSQIVGLLRPWLNTMDGDRVSPPAALDDLRRREREAALLEAADVIESNAGNERMTGAFAANYLRDRADAIASERDYITDAGKKVNHPEIPESSGGER